MPKRAAPTLVAAKNIPLAKSKQTRSAHHDENIMDKKAKLLKPRVAANGHKLPDPLPPGEILTDVTKRHWQLGKSIGVGGFGEIYLASDDLSKPVNEDAKYVIKVEHHTNGPLFAEMHFYHRVGKADLIDEWMKSKKLDFLGMPKFVASGSHEFKNTKYRFMVMDRFGEDLQKILDRSERVFPLKTVYTLGVRILDILEYIHSYGYIHADVKASNLLLGYGKGKENQVCRCKVYLVDFGLACRYMQDGKHKKYEQDLRKAHDGTIEFTSRDAHIGAHSRRGDLENLGYNMLQWLCGRLPWEDNLRDPEYVSQQKYGFMDNIPLLMNRCFPDKEVPEGIFQYMTYVSQLKFDDKPDYKHCKTILRRAIKKAGLKDDGKLVFPEGATKTPTRSSRVRKTPQAGTADNGTDYNNCGGCSSGVRKKSQKALSERGQGTPKGESLKNASAPSRLLQEKSSSEEDSSLENPTPAMLLVMQKRLEMQQQEGGAGGGGGGGGGGKNVRGGKQELGMGSSAGKSKTVATQTSSSFRPFLAVQEEQGVGSTSKSRATRTTKRSHSKSPVRKQAVKAKLSPKKARVAPQRLSPYSARLLRNKASPEV